MIRTMAEASEEAVGYPQMIQGKETSGYRTVIAYQMNEQQAVVIHSNAHDVPSGRLICDKDTLKNYFKVFHGTLTLES